MAWTVTVLAAVAACRMTQAVSYGAQVSPYGLLVTGSLVEGTQGFQKNIIYLTEAEVEQLKDNKDPQAYGLGECWLSDARYSSYDNHGEGNYHYTIAQGIDVPALVRSAASAGAEFYTVYSSDSYSTKMRLTDMDSMKYFAPGDAQGVLSAPPMIAFYKTTETGSPESAKEPEGLPERLPQGKETYVYGQKTPEESNNCHYIHGANAVVVGEPLTAIRSDSNRYAVLRLHELLALGSQDREYRFEDQGQETVHHVRGVPLWNVLSQMRLDTYIPEGSSAHLDMISEDGAILPVNRETIEGCMAVWDYADGMACPGEQTGEMAVYLPGNTKGNSILFNLAKINVTDADGIVLTGPDVTPDVTVSPAPDVTPEVPDSLPAPGAFEAAAASYRSIRLRWEKTAGADGYYIYRYQPAAGKYKRIQTLKASASSYTDTGLKVNTTYKYRIRAWKEGKETLLGRLSRTVSAKPVLDKTRIQKITRQKTGGVKLKWKAVPGASGYEIYRSAKKGSGYRKVGNVKKSVRTFTDKKAKKKTFYYKVRPFRKTGKTYQYGAFSFRAVIRP